MNDIKLSSRLTAVLDTAIRFSPDKSRIIDVGSDHGHLAAVALTEHGFRNALLTDIHEDPARKSRTLMKDLGLEDRMTTKVGLLSGGQRQAVTLLMASLKKPELLLLDEHTAALDPKTAAKVLEISDQIINEYHLTALMVTHNMKDAIVHGNRLIMMNEGRIIYDVRGEEKKNLHVKDLLAKFEEISGSEFANDRMMLS